MNDSNIAEWIAREKADRMKQGLSCRILHINDQAFRRALESFGVEIAFTTNMHQGNKHQRFMGMWVEIEDRPLFGIS